MGWGKTKIYVDSGVAPICGGVDDDRTHYFIETVIAACVNELDIVACLNDTYLNGTGIKMNRYFRFGISDQYVQPPPIGRLTTCNLTDEEIYTLIPDADMVLNTSLAEFNSDFPCFAWLSNNYGYSPEEDTVAVLPSGVTEPYTVFSDLEEDTNEIFACFIDPEEIDKEVQEEDDDEPYNSVDIPTGIIVSETQMLPSNQYIQVLYRSINTTDVLAPEVVITSTDIEDTEGNYFKTTTETDLDTFEYVVTDSKVTVVIEKGKTITTTTSTVTRYSPCKYFEYLIGSGEQPDIDDKFLSSAIADLYPCIRFRYKKDDEFHESKKNTWYYKQSEKLLKKGGFKLSSLYDGLYGKDSGGDVGSINFMYFIPAVPANSNETTTHRYFFEFLQTMSRDLYSRKDYQDALNSGLSLKAVSRKFTKTMSYIHNGLVLYYEYGYVDYSEHTGVVCREGKYVIKSNGSFAGKTVVQIQHQTGPDTYAQVEFMDISCRYPIYGGKSTTHHFYSSSQNKKDSKFVFPLSYEAKKRMGLWHFTQLTTDCFQYVWGAYKKVHTSGWKRIFKFMFKVVGTVVASFGSILDWAMVVVTTPLGIVLGQVLTGIVRAILCKTQELIKGGVALVMRLGGKLVNFVTGGNAKIAALLIIAAAVTYMVFTGDVAQTFKLMTYGLNMVSSNLNAETQRLAAEMKALQEKMDADMEIIDEAMKSLNKQSNGIIKRIREFGKYLDAPNWDTFSSNLTNLSGELLSDIDAIHYIESNIIPVPMGIMLEHLNNTDEEEF